MSKADLVSYISKEAAITKKAAEAAVNSLIGAIHSVVKSNGKIRIGGLGTFRVTKRKARTGVNPQTGAKIKIPAKNAPAFTAAKALKDTARKTK